MPTIKQLPLATRVAPEDVVPISQGGVTRNASVGLLLANVQPAIIAPQNALLGRTSLGPGGPEPVQLGLGLGLAAGRLAATGTDHAAFPQAATLSDTDEVVLNSTAGPRRIPVATMRDQLAVAGPAGPRGADGREGPAGTRGAPGLDGAPGQDGLTGPRGLPGQSGSAGRDGLNGIIGPAGPSGPKGDGLEPPTLANTYTTTSGADLVVVVPVAGARGYVSRDTLLVSAGVGVDGLPPVLAPQPTNLLPLEQPDGLNALSLTQLSGFVQAQPRRTVEEISGFFLNRANHIGTLVVCRSSGITTITTAYANLGAGFTCEVLNLGTGTVFFGAGFTASGRTSLPQNGTALIRSIPTGASAGVVLSTTPPSSGTDPVLPSSGPAFAGVLDGMASAPYAAYSVRRLLSAYNGPAIRVVPSLNPSVPVNVGFTPAGHLDLVALANVVGSGHGDIDVWYDQSGTRNRIQPDPARRPRIVTSGGVEAHPGAAARAGLRFLHSGQVSRLDGSDYDVASDKLAMVMILAANADPQVARVVSYNKPGQSNSGDDDFGDAGSAVLLNFGGYTAGSRAVRNGSFAQSDTFPAVLGTSVVVSTVYDGANQSLFLDGQRRASTSSAGNFGGAGSSLFIGAHNSAATDKAFKGHIGEVVVWRALSAADRNTMEASARTYFGEP